MQETGKIIKVKRSQAVVRVDRKSACGSCGACAMKPSQMHVDISLPNTLGAKGLKRCKDEYSGLFDTDNFRRGVARRFLLDRIARMGGCSRLFRRIGGGFRRSRIV